MLIACRCVASFLERGSTFLNLECRQWLQYARFWSLSHEYVRVLP
jgi:hypothetical protein